MTNKQYQQHDHQKDKPFSNSPFFIKLFSWEYWPMPVIYFPIVLYWLYLSIKARSLFFFAATNPGINLGGLSDDSKIDLFDKIPKHLIPTTLFFKANTTSSTIMAAIEKAGLSFPVIAKPDKGERGFLVEKINNLAELERYLKQFSMDFLIQEFIDYTEEVTILHYRFPGKEKGHISSFTYKEMLHVVGDGNSTITELMRATPRSLLQLNRLQQLIPEKLLSIPQKDEIVWLEPIGNHNRGTIFWDRHDLIDEQLIDTFDKINKQIDGLYFGRYDLKCKNIADLKQGKGIKILEINGVKAEPAHIYDPNFSIINAYKVLFKQWRTIYEISEINRKMGVKVPTTTTGLKQFYHYVFTYKKNITR